MSKLNDQNTDSITWWGIGLSILAANIAYDYIHVGASLGYTRGLALGSYEWTGSLLMIFVLLFIFPEMMSSGVKTTPEYLGLRFNLVTRKSVAIIMVFMHVFVVMVPVLYSAALSLNKWYGLSYSLWLIIGVLIISAVLLFQDIVVLMRINIILITLMFIVGIGVMFYCFYLVGGINKFAELGAPRITAFLSADDTMLPWHSVVFGGLWVAHAYYWSYNQFIQQFVLPSNTLSKAQFGFLFTASLKLLIPFIILIPGITLYILRDQIPLDDPENAFPTFIVSVLPSKVSGVILIIYLLTLLSTFSSVGFASINIVLNDLLNETIVKKINSTKLYRGILILIMSISLTGAYFLKSLEHLELMKYNQFITNSFTPSLVAVFTLGIFVKFISSIAANVSIIISIPLFLLLRWLYPNLDILNSGGIAFLFQCLLLVILSFIFREESRAIPVKRAIKFERNLLVVIWSILLVTAVLFIYFVLM